MRTDLELAANLAEGSKTKIGFENESLQPKSG